jgi:hypothetical protein
MSPFSEVVLNEFTYSTFYNALLNSHIILSFAGLFKRRNVFK